MIAAASAFNRINWRADHIVLMCDSREHYINVHVFGSLHWIDFPQEKLHINNFSVTCQTGYNLHPVCVCAQTNRHLIIIPICVCFSFFISSVWHCLVYRWTLHPHVLCRVLWIMAHNSGGFVSLCSVNTEQRVQAPKQIANESGIIFIYLLNRNYKEFESNARGATMDFRNQMNSKPLKLFNKQLQI